MPIKNTKRWAYALIIFTALVPVFVVAISPGFIDMGDGLTHYSYARFAFDHPLLFFKRWGKPIFTLLSSPFAQLGYIGMVIFNALAYVITALSLLGIAKYFDLKNRGFLIFLLILQPVYFKMIAGGMTEILFGALVSSAFYFLLKKKYILGAILISFTIFSRPEAQFIIPLVLLYLIIHSPKHIPFLLTGFVIYGFAGMCFFHDFFWYFTKNPYKGEINIYGSGDIFRFIKNAPNEYGVFIWFGFLLSTILIIVHLLKRFRYGFFAWLRSDVFTLFLFFVIPVFGVIGVHSWIWYKGIHGSLGLLRVLATTSPFLALLSLYTLNQMYKIKAFKGRRLLAIFGGIGFLIFLNFNAHTIWIIPQDQTQAMLKNAGHWYKTYTPKQHLSYLDPYFAFESGVDPFDSENITLLWSLDVAQPSKFLHTGDIIMWDGHFGPNEGRISENAIFKDTNLLPIFSVFPAQKRIISLNNHNYELHFFRVEKEQNLLAVDTFFSGEYPRDSVILPAVFSNHNPIFYRVRLTRLKEKANIEMSFLLEGGRPYFYPTDEKDWQNNQHYFNIPGDTKGINIPNKQSFRILIMGYGRKE